MLESTGCHARLLTLTLRSGPAPLPFVNMIAVLSLKSCLGLSLPGQGLDLGARAEECQLCPELIVASPEVGLESSRNVLENAWLPGPFIGEF